MPLEFEHGIQGIQVQIDKLLDLADRRGIDVSSEVEILREKLLEISQQTYQNLSPMEQVLVARHPKRPYTLDYINLICTDWIELHGDRAFRDDQAIVGGWARIRGRTVMMIGHQKGRTMKDNLSRNFGMPHPEGYRKALRLMKQAEKFGRPVVTLIDTPGAYPGIGAEERGQGEAIATNLREMARLRTPLISVIIGEGGSGGALALGVTDRIMMLEHSVYSVISPEGCSAILWRSAEHREEAASALQLTAENLLDHGVCDEIIPEPVGGAHSNWDSAGAHLENALDRVLSELTELTIEQLLESRWAKYEAIGTWREA
ncbi:MAG: acetyl-CoA carboxylase carboxyltransferase subunit alpha [bacterium]|jgi:acetyl-CoA carboxylase carboxyl transferase subunit alpha|nr:acetyl-CoA carboxylase carboxyltransferase subunit alpha [Gemmatimonadota bacterium]HIL89369.1 acetyl-CoA carboxylase carboxyltransferase subunit alpha [Gemmatimonadota bacterium]